MGGGMSGGMGGYSGGGMSGAMGGASMGGAMGGASMGMSSGGAMGGAEMGGGMGGGADCATGNCEGMLKTVVRMEKRTVPCIQKSVKHYKVKVAKQITVPQQRKVTWTDYVKETKSVPYTDYKMENRVKFKNVKMTVPDVRTVTDMVKITRKVPKTIYVDVTRTEPRTRKVHCTKTVNKTIKIPYQASVPVQKFRNETKMVPVKKEKYVTQNC